MSLKYEPASEPLHIHVKDFEEAAPLRRKFEVAERDRMLAVCFVPPPSYPTLP